jgi:hypothetical protein
MISAGMHGYWWAIGLFVVAGLVGYAYRRRRT